MNDIRLIKQRVCLVIFSLGICLTTVGQFDNTFIEKTTTDTTIESDFHKVVVKN